MKKRINIFLVIFLIIVGVGVTLAYFTSTADLENIFITGKYKTTTEEEFESPDNWKPGDTVSKSIITTNEGTLPVRVRVKLEGTWTSANGDELPLKYNNEDVAIINFDNASDWVLEDGYYYYKGELEPGDSTSSLISGVTFNPNVGSDVACTSNNGVYVCESTGDGYDDATFILRIISHTVQSDAVLSAWNLEYDPILPKYIVQITTTGGVTTKYETVESAVAALQDGDLFETIGKLEYDQIIDIINKEVTISGEIEFTSNSAMIQISGKTLTLKDLTITGISNFPVMTSGTNKSRNTRIYVGENSNVSITGLSHAIGNNYGKIEIHSGTYRGEKAIYCGGSQSGGYFETEVYGSDTHLYGDSYIFHSFSNAVLSVTEGVDINLSSSTGKEILYQGGNATFNIPTSYTIQNAGGGSYTRNGPLV